MLIDSVLIICAYLLGSFSSAVVVCQLMRLPDPRTQGSGNPGATNVLRHGGKKAALITLSLDILKGVIAVFLAKLLILNEFPSTGLGNDYLLASVTLAVFLGHLYPIFFGFRGGKGVATAFGALIVLVWQVGLAVLMIWLSMALIFRYSSLAAITATVLMPVIMYWVTGLPGYVAMSIIMSTLLIWRHWSNILNLLAGKEDKINLGF